MSEKTSNEVAPTATEAPDMTVSTRDAEDLRRRLTDWLAGQLPEGARPEVPEIGSNSANGPLLGTCIRRCTAK